MGKHQSPAADPEAPTDEENAMYVDLIDEILSFSDLQTISAKRIRRGLQERMGHDISHHKGEINSLIMTRFDHFSSQQNRMAEPDKRDPVTQRKPTAKRKADLSDEDLSDAADMSTPSTPVTKKAKKSNETRDADEELARRLQEQENAGRARSTRGGGALKRKPVAKKAKVSKKKSQARVGSDVDSNLEDGGKVEKEKKGGFHKPMSLSEPLSAMLQETALSRPQTVKKIWAYVRERDLQDPSDKRQIRCDDAMRAVFKQDKVHMFTMNKLLASHLYPVDE